MRYIFVSYSHGKHKPFIDVLSQYLKPSGFMLIDGQKKRTQSADSAFAAIRRANAFVALVSSHPPNVMLELGIAIGLGKPILVVASSSEDSPSNLGGFLTVREGESPRDLALEVVRRIDQLEIPSIDIHVLSEQTRKRLDLDIQATLEQRIWKVLNLLKEDPNMIYSLDPRMLEELVAEIYRYLGFRVELSGESLDRGIDFKIAEPDSRRTAVVQVKRRSPHSKVSVKDIRELIGATILCNANKGILVTTSTFTRSAHDLVERSPVEIELMDTENLLSKCSGKIKPII